MKASRNARDKNAEEWSKAGSFMRKPDRGWLHSDQAIKDGGVCYALKYLGCIEVVKSMRALQYEVRQQATKEAMYRCCEANGYKFSKRKKANKTVIKLLADHPRTAHSGTFISLTVSVAGIVLTDMSSGEVISKHDMQGISFASGGEKDCPDIVGYVAKDARNRRACHVLDCPQNLSYDVINTIGQAFELRYKMFLHEPPKILTTPKRFADAIFAEEDRTIDRTYDEPMTEDVFADSHEYDSVNDDLDDDAHEYKVPRPCDPPCKMSNYDTPHGTIASQQDIEYFEVERPSDRGDLGLDFAVGTQFDAAARGSKVSSASYNNPLASPTVGNGQGNVHDNSGTEVSFLERNDWERFGEDLVPNLAPVPVPAVRVRTQSPVNLVEPIDISGPDHNTLGYALPLPKRPPEETQRKTPPPLPRPFSRRNIISNSEPDEETPKKTVNDLSTKLWFHGPMARQDAEKVLSRNGDFLVRESTTNPGQYVLSGQQNGYPKHLLLVDPDGVVRTKDQSFDSVDHLIRYHQDNKIPIISSGSVIFLRQVVAKNNPGHSLYDLPV